MKTVRSDDVMVKGELKRISFSQQDISQQSFSPSEIVDSLHLITYFTTYNVFSLFMFY